jgi:hypothetical protein
MTKLTHEFYNVSDEFIKTVSQKKVSRSDVRNYSRPFEVHDDIILFIFGTLKWIEVHNYTNKKVQYGLYYHGISIIYPDQIKIFHNIILNWKSMFNYALEVISPYKNIEEIKMQREEIIVELNKFGNFLISVIEKKEYLIHIGI